MAIINPFPYARLDTVDDGGSQIEQHQEWIDKFG
jgi:hypothetical protein